MMGRTIIQPIGPLYGEAVNGTVFGRPNGSIYVPPTNTITIRGYTAYIASYQVGGAYRLRFKQSDSEAYQRYGYAAASQDVTSFVRSVVATDNELNTIVASFDFNAGQFNTDAASNLALNYQVENGETYYVAVQLINNGTVIATSEIIEVTGYVSE